MRIVSDAPFSCGSTLMAAACALVACSEINVARLTNETFQPKASAQEVQILQEEPACPHLRLAELEADEGLLSSPEGVEIKMRQKAADLGADALLLLGPAEYLKRRLKYQQDLTILRPAIGWNLTAYPGWGYGAPSSDPGYSGGGFGETDTNAERPGYGFGAHGFSAGATGLGRGMGVATPYEVPVTGLRGIALRYTGETPGTC